MGRIGMLGYSFTTLFVKLAVRTGYISSFAVFAVATAMVAVSSVATAVMRGELAIVPSQANVPPGTFTTSAHSGEWKSANARSAGPASITEHRNREPAIDAGERHERQSEREQGRA
jgi:hypothetical protein